MARQTEGPTLATPAEERPRRHLVSASLDDDLERRLDALSRTRSLAGPEFRAVVAGLVAALDSLNPTLAHRALIALASLGPPATPHLLEHFKTGVSSRAHSSLGTALAIAALRADPETRSTVWAALASRAGEENPPSPLWFAYRAALTWLDG